MTGDLGKGRAGRGSAVNFTSNTHQFLILVTPFLLSAIPSFPPFPPQALNELEALTKWRHQYQCNPSSYYRPFLPSTLPPYVSASSSIATSACSLSSSADKEGGDEEGEESLHPERTVYDDNRALFGDSAFYEDGTSPSPDGSLPPSLTPSPPLGKGVMGSSERSAFSSYVAGNCV